MFVSLAVWVSTKESAQEVEPGVSALKRNQMN